MKLTGARFKDHPIVGNLELNFVNQSTGQPYDTIIFAGENGTGKTAILMSISSFLNIGPFEFLEYLEYTVQGSIYKAVPANTNFINFFNIQMPDGTLKNIKTDRHNNFPLIATDTTDPRSYGCVYSKARADYKTDVIRNSSTKKLDVEKYDLDNEEDFTSLKQLIVDVTQQDNAEYARLNKSLGATPRDWHSFFETSNIYRFQNAFNSFFEKLQFQGVQDVTDEKVILFEKNSHPVPVDKLSTGEKQIVFRGTYLLKNNNNLNGSVILVDEPELSMHPKWQQKILPFYQTLFVESGSQKAQLFIASHSEYVVKSALENKASCVVIVLTETAGVINAKKIDAPAVLPTITAAETNYLAFDVVSNDYHIELYGWLQNKFQLSTVKGCDQYIVGQPEYDPAVHRRASAFRQTTYDTLCTYIRNAIDHPSPGNTFTETELRTSIELLIKLCR